MIQARCNLILLDENVLASVIYNKMLFYGLNAFLKETFRSEYDFVAICILKDSALYFCFVSVSGTDGLKW